MTSSELDGLMRPVLAAAVAAGRAYERRPADRRGPEPVLDDGAARGNPPAVCALTRPHLRRAFEAGRERERAATFAADSHDEPETDRKPLAFYAAGGFRAEDAARFGDYFAADEGGAYPGDLHRHFGTDLRAFAEASGLVRQQLPGPDGVKRWHWVRRPAARGPGAAPSANARRLLLMLEAKAAGDDAAVDRLAALPDHEIVVQGPDARTFASEHQDGDRWETNGRHYVRAGGETRRVPDPNAPDEGGSEERPEPVTAPAPAPEPKPAPASEPTPAAPKEEAPNADEPSSFDEVLSLIGDTPEERAATVLSWVSMPVFPDSRQRLEEGLTEFFGGNHDVGSIMEKQYRKLSKDPDVPSPERAAVGLMADLFSGNKGLGDAILDNLQPVKESLHGKKAAMNLIEGATLALSVWAPGVGSVVGGAIDETASQLIEKGETDWKVIAKEAAKAATIGFITRKLGLSAKKGGAKLAKKVGKLASKLGTTAGQQAEKWANKGAQAAVDRGEEALKHRAQQALLDPRAQRRE